MTRTQIALVVFAVALLSFLPSQAMAGHLNLTPTGFVSTKAVSTAPISGGALMFDLSSIPSGSRIDLAELTVTVTSDTSLGEFLDVFVGPASETWASSANPVTGKIGTVDTLLADASVATGVDQTIQINVTDLVNLWYRGKLPNNGVTLSIPGDGSKLFTLATTGGQVTVTLSVFFSR